MTVSEWSTNICSTSLCSCGGCRRCCRGSRIRCTLRKKPISIGHQSHCVHVSLQLGFKKKTPGNLCSSLEHWYPYVSTQTPLNLINKHVTHGAGTCREVVRCSDICSVATPFILSRWSDQRHCCEHINPPPVCLLFCQKSKIKLKKATALIFVWLNQSQVRGLVCLSERYLATWSQGCFICVFFLHAVWNEVYI